MSDEVALNVFGMLSHLDEGFGDPEKQNPSFGWILPIDLGVYQRV